MITHLKFKTTVLFRTFLFCCLYIGATIGQLKAADYYWVGGSGNWSDYANHWATSSGGVIFHTTIPSLNDNVFFDSNSFSADSQSVYTDNTFLYCLNMDWSGVQYAVRLIRLPGSGSYPIKIFGNLILNSNIVRFEARVELNGSSGNFQLDPQGVQIDYDVTIPGPSTWDLLSELKCGDLKIQSGTFNSNNHKITAKFFSVYYPSWPTVNLGSSELHCAYLQVYDNINFNSAGVNVHFDQPFINNELRCNNCTFKNVYFYFDDSEVMATLTADSVFFYADGAIERNFPYSNYIDVDYLYCADRMNFITNNNSLSTIGRGVFEGDVVFFSNVAFDTLEWNSPGQAITIKDTLYINHELVALGSCEYYSTLSGSTISNGLIIMPTGTPTLNYFIISDMIADGGAQFTANNCFDQGNNSGWNFSTPLSRDLYWVNGQGEWSDPTHWAITSGGAGGNCPPNLADNVFIDNLSFVTTEDTIFLDNPKSYCGNFVLDASLNSPAISPIAGFTNRQNKLMINGDFRLLTEVNNTVEYYLIASDSGNIIETGLSAPKVNFQGSGEWSLSSASSFSDVYFYEGEFNTNDYNMSANLLFAITSLSLPKINLGSSTVNCTSFNMTAIGANLVSDSANLILDTLPGSQVWSYMRVSQQSFNNIHFKNKGVVIGTFSCKELRFDRNDSILSFNATIEKLLLNDDSHIQGTVNADSIILLSPGSKFTFGSNSVLNVGSELNISGTSCDSMTVISSSATGTINKTSGSVNLEFVYLKNIVGSGGASFNAANSIDGGGNSGWTINSIMPRTLYWIGGSGNWNNKSNWALSSGGPGGNCIPNYFDQVYFDNNSFSPTGNETVVVDLYTVECSGFYYDVSYPGKKFDINGNTDFIVNGNFIINYPTEFDGTGSYRNNFRLQSVSAFDSVKTSATNLNNVTVNGQGSHYLLDSLKCYWLFFESGDFITSNFPVNCGRMNILSPFAGVDFGSSTLYCDSANFSLSGSGVNTQDLTIYFSTFSSSGSKRLVSNNHQFNKLISNQYLWLQGGVECRFAELDYLYYSTTDPSHQLQIQKAVFNDGFTLNDGLTASPAYAYIFDTLIWNNPGEQMQIRANSVLKINDTLIVNNSPGFPTELLNYDPLLTGMDYFYIEKDGGVLCMDNMLLKGVHSTGNALYYAGANSVDLGNNSGWIYASCNPNNSDVWPGDANYDLTVDNFDVLYLGLAYGQNGPARTGASNTWVAQPASDWLYQFANGANLKNADCNGNGVVNDDDTTAISLNYGLTHPLRVQPPLVSALPPVELFLVANPDTAMLGDTVLIDIHLGTPLNPVDSIYGIAFTISFDSTLIDTTYMEFDYSGSWMGTQGSNLLNFEKKFLSQGRVDVAITRTDYLNAAGDGIIVTTGVVVIDNIGAKLASAPPYVNFPVTLSNPRALTAAEYYLAISLGDDSVEIDTSQTVGVPDLNQATEGIRVFPVPANGNLFIQSDNVQITEIEIFDMMGAVTAFDLKPSFSQRLDVSDLPNGVYGMKIVTPAGMIKRKLVIKH